MREGTQVSPAPSRLTPKGQQTQGHVLSEDASGMNAAGQVLVLQGEPGSAAVEETGWPFLCHHPHVHFSEMRDGGRVQGMKARALSCQQVSAGP